MRRVSFNLKNNISIIILVVLIIIIGVVIYLNNRQQKDGFFASGIENIIEGGLVKEVSKR